MLMLQFSPIWLVESPSKWFLFLFRYPHLFSKALPYFLIQQDLPVLSLPQPWSQPWFQSPSPFRGAEGTITSIIMKLPWQTSGFLSGLFLLLCFISFSLEARSLQWSSNIDIASSTSSWSLFRRNAWPRSPWVPYLKNISFLSFSPLLCLIFLGNIHYMMPHCVFITYLWEPCDSWGPSARYLMSTWH